MCFLFPICSVYAAYEDHHAEGWHWYEEIRHQEVADEKAHEKLGSQNQKPHSDPIKTLQNFKKKVEDLKAIAVMQPTFSNVRAYMEIQKILLERSSRFAQKWIEVVYLRPELDYTLKHPISQVGRHVVAEDQKKQMEDNIRALSQTHGLFFFFSSKCGYCKAFAPIVKSFSKKYGWQVLAISMDGTTLPEFPKAQNDNGSASSLGIKTLPTLLAVEPKSGQVIPLSYGLSTHDQIEDRIRVLLMRRAP
ncbi:MAG TPA: type-F conjugative transfer system pilin assembly protein TraF [Alphaproteobacteria bacterium]|nr:type-F conjugative transfer system pilin assembly protein TraF [Alphaproteobacteria bacterium]